MVLQEIKNQLREIIEDESDGEKLKEILALLKSPEAYRRLTSEEYAQEIDEAKEQIKKGDFTSQEDLERESEDW